jgi:hypothetical protein
MTLDSGGNRRQVVVTEPAPAAPSTVLDYRPTATYQSPGYRDPTPYGGTGYGGYGGTVINSEIDAARGAYAMAPAAVVTPPSAVGTYVTTNRLEPIVVERDIVVGAPLPRTVELQPIPDYRYQYVYLNNGQPVLVDPATRRIVYVFP